MNRDHLKTLALLAVPLLISTHATPALADPYTGNGDGGGYNHHGYGQRGGGNAQPGDRQRHEQLMQSLNLTPDQKERVQALRQQALGQTQDLRQRLESRRQELMQLMQSPNADPGQAHTINSDINNIQKQLDEQRINTWFQMRQVLKPEQVQRLQEMRAQRRTQQGGQGGGMQELRGGGNGPGGRGQWRQQGGNSGGGNYRGGRFGGGDGYNQ